MRILNAIGLKSWIDRVESKMKMVWEQYYEEDTPITLNNLKIMISIAIEIGVNVDHNVRSFYSPGTQEK